jgi:hypothetical protein
VARIQVRRSDSLLNGFLIGAAVGAGTIVALAFSIDRNEADEYGPATALYGAIGGGIGIGIDALIRGKRTVFMARSGAHRVSVQPIVTARAQGLRVSLTF